MHRNSLGLSAILAAMFMLAAGAGAGAGAGERAYYYGADLSYVNEMEDCGARFSYQGRNDAYEIFKVSGTNLVRVRLWNNPDWTKYSNLADVEKTIARAHAQGLKVLLDFHYSDDWADGEKQLAPKAWAKLSTEAQAKALYDFTYDTLMRLEAKGLMPEMVQVGNETNHEIVSSLEGAKKPSNWERNAKLFNAGIKAVRDAGAKSQAKPQNKPLIMLHIAQPENIEWWFDAAHKAGVTDYDVIGLSYYRKWSKMDLGGLSGVIRRTYETYHKEVVVVETAYPFTNDGADASPNLLGPDTLIPAYPATIEGQARYMHDLMQLTLDNGGTGVVYWEPAWVSTKCRTRWGQGSNWENAAFFDFKGEAIAALEWPKASYVMPVPTAFHIKAAPDVKTLYFGADFLAGATVRFERSGDEFIYRTWLRPGVTITFAAAATPQALDTAEAQSVKVPVQGGDIRLELP